MTEQAYPLSWPIGWPRTPAHERIDGRFSRRERRYFQSGTSYTANARVTIAEGVKRIMGEIKAFTRSGHRWRIDPDAVVISSNLRTRRDGLPASGQRQPDDPGVAVYFELDGKPQCVPCDAYTTVEQNLAAVAATLNALRALERHGSGIMERAFTGFAALPHLADDPWWIVLGLSEDAPFEVIEQTYRRLRSEFHPDKGGTAHQFDRVQKAYERAQESAR